MCQAADAADIDIDMSCASFNNVKLKNKERGRERAAEGRDGDEILFRQPESTHLGDCPICFLPLQIDLYRSTLLSCCSKVICKGCRRANKLSGVNKNVHHTCPMCRQPMPRSNEEFNRNNMKRVTANDPVAVKEAGKKHYHEGHYRGAFEYWTKASELGNVDAIYLLSLLYRDGRGVEKNEEKEWYQLEEAAIAGHVGARFALAHNEKARHGSIDRAVKHFIIAANLGCNNSMEALKQFYTKGDVSDDKFTAALHTHQAAIDEMKSPQREEQANLERIISRKVAKKSCQHGDEAYIYSWSRIWSHDPMKLGPF